MTVLPREINLFLMQKLEKPRPYKSGIKACCPFHQEDTPSFFVFYSDKFYGWFWKCHGCPPEKSSGSLHNLLYRLSGPIELAVRPEFQSRTRYEEPVSRHLPDSTLGLPDIVDYYVTRGISEEIAKRFKFKQIMGEQPAAVMPIYFDKQYRGHVRRYLDPRIPYRYEMESLANLTDVIWGWDYINTEETVVITEGIIDAAVFWTHGIQAVALVTGKKWSGKEYLHHLTDPICVPDNGDQHSVDSFFQMALKLGGRLAFIPPEYKDASDFVMSEPEAMEKFRRYNALTIS